MPELHEFYLKYPFDKKSEGLFYRICLGDLILESERETLTHAHSVGKVDNYSGSIGFIDLYHFSETRIEILEFGIEPIFRAKGDYAKKS